MAMSDVGRHFVRGPYLVGKGSSAAKAEAQRRRRYGQSKVYVAAELQVFASVTAENQLNLGQSS
jgi:hypothetical protein